MNKLKLLAIMALLVAYCSVYAEEGGHVGGGKIKETDLKYMMTRLDSYLYSEEGQKEFPEVTAYDKDHPTESIHEIIRKTNPVAREGQVRDDFNAERDCVSHFEDSNNRYFECNANALPDYKLENQPSLYRFLFHEILVQAKLESPKSPSVPSVYPISSRLNLHLETYQEWLPGSAILGDRVECIVAFRDLESGEPMTGTSASGPIKVGFVDLKETERTLVESTHFKLTVKTRRYHSQGGSVTLDFCRKGFDQKCEMISYDSSGMKKNEKAFIYLSIPGSIFLWTSCYVY